MPTMRERSKQNWDGDANLNDINGGSLQRIADACELMAKRYSDLIDERDRYKRYYEDGSARLLKAERKAAALRGVITRLKKK